MSGVRIQVVTAVKSASLVRFVYQDSAALPKGIAKAEFSGKKLSTVLLRDGGQRTLYVGLGKKETFQPDTIRRAAGVAAKSFLKIEIGSLAFDLTAWAGFAQEAVEGALLGAYRFEEYKLAESRRKVALSALLLQVASRDVASVKKLAVAGQILAESTNYTRSIGNQPPNVMTPAALGEAAKALARECGLKATVLDVPALRKGKFGGILAVGQGSEAAPRLIALEYWGGGKKTAPIAIIGKAITFDTGGISLKPGAQMDEMKFDKLGGCAALGAIRAIAKLKLPISVVAVVAAAENMPDGRSYRPGDIVTSYDGKTIEVLNTDAEGRIVLADALAYARKTYQPRYMMDMATLTGACVVALGQYTAGLFTENQALLKALQEAGKATGDSVWHLPVNEDYDSEVKSDVATAKNTGNGRWGGASTAASFLKIWVEKTPWAHLDIAGTAWLTHETAYLEKGATGFGVRLMVEAARKL